VSECEPQLEARAAHKYKPAAPAPALRMQTFRWGRISLEVPEEGFLFPYATFVADEYYFLDAGLKDVVVDAGAYVGDFTVKAAARAKLVIAVEPDPGMGKGMKRLFAISKRET